MHDGEIVFCSFFSFLLFLLSLSRSRHTMTKGLYWSLFAVLDVSALLVVFSSSSTTTTTRWVDNAKMLAQCHGWPRRNEKEERGKNSISHLVWTLVTMVALTRCYFRWTLDDPTLIERNKKCFSLSLFCHWENEKSTRVQSETERENTDTRLRLKSTLFE